MLLVHLKTFSIIFLIKKTGFPLFFYHCIDFALRYYLQLCALL